MSFKHRKHEMLFRLEKLVTEVKWPIRSSLLFPCQSVLCHFRITLKLEKTRLVNTMFSNTAFYPLWVMHCLVEVSGRIALLPEGGEMGTPVLSAGSV